MQKSRLFLALSLAVGVTTVANAQATRTWVSGVGDDVNPCSRTAPCKTFAGAISKTAAGGEIDVLDPGGFGGVTITKALTIDGNGTFASILASGVNGIQINVGSSNDVVTIRNLSINGATSGQSTGGLNGIRLVTSSGFAPKALHIDGVQTFALNPGYSLENTTGFTRIFIDNCVVRNNVSEGIAAVPSGAGSVNVEVSRSLVNQNGTIGLSLGGTSTASVTHCVFAGDPAGVQGGGPARLHMEDPLG